MDHQRVILGYVRYNTELTHEIEELIDREADMINRGRPAKSLEGN
jgi:hypothetical protein